MLPPPGAPAPFPPRLPGKAVSLPFPSPRPKSPGALFLLPLASLPPGLPVPGSGLPAALPHPPPVPGSPAASRLPAPFPAFGHSVASLPPWSLASRFSPAAAPLAWQASAGNSGDGTLPLFSFLAPLLKCRRPPALLPKPHWPLRPLPPLRPSVLPPPQLALLPPQALPPPPGAGPGHRHWPPAGQYASPSGSALR